MTFNIEIDENGNKYFTCYNGLCILNESGITNVQEKNTSLPTFKLSQNYPNPFNPETTISYNLKKIGIVEINIYDLQGKCIATIPQGLKQAKRQYDFKYNFNGHASGVYIYQIKAREYGTSNISVKSKKMILLK